MTRMREEVEEVVLHFLKNVSPIRKPLLVGFSGGGDSLALVSCLIELGIHFHLAHFDHGWRKESEEEALKLKRWAETLAIAFHMDKGAAEKKGELEARELRYHFFERLYRSGEFEALVLAHHRQDLAETVLKRVFEGAHLTHIQGMRPISKRGEMPIWRPLLSASKESVLDYLSKRALSPIQDATNFDPKYLRGRMRTLLFPLLRDAFGKEIIPALELMANRSEALSHYLDQKGASIIFIDGPFGRMWDFVGVHEVEIEHVIATFFRGKGGVPSYHVLKRFTETLRLGVANQMIRFGGHTCFVDRGRCFWLSALLPVFITSVPLQEGSIQLDGWKWEISISSDQSAGHGWQYFWKEGKVEVQIPSGNHLLIPPSKVFRSNWNREKVPAFLRGSLPCIEGDLGIAVGEFLLEKNISRNENGMAWLVIALKKVV